MYRLRIRGLGLLGLGLLGLGLGLGRLLRGFGTRRVQQLGCTDGRGCEAGVERSDIEAYLRRRQGLPMPIPPLRRQGTSSHHLHLGQNLGTLLRDRARGALVRRNLVLKGLNAFGTTLRLRYSQIIIPGPLWISISVVLLLAEYRALNCDLCRYKISTAYSDLMLSSRGVIFTIFRPDFFSRNRRKRRQQEQIRGWPI